jgi:hypothetical protein
MVGRECEGSAQAEEITNAGSRYLSAAEIKRMTGISQQTVSKWRGRLEDVEGTPPANCQRTSISRHPKDEGRSYAVPRYDRRAFASNARGWP